MKLICISGKAGAGKDTVGCMIADYLCFNGHTAGVIHNADLVKMICTTLFGWNGIKDEAGRKLLQEVGTDIVRAQDPDYWVRSVYDIVNLFQEKFEYIVIPDCRFPNEIEYHRDRGLYALSVRVEREDITQYSPERLSHISETAMDHYLHDVTIRNNGTLGQLRRDVEAFCDTYFLSKE